MSRKIVVLISLGLLLVACGSSSRAAGPTRAVPTPTTASWNNYTSADGEFSIAYPPEYTLYQNQIPSVDGVWTDAPNAIALQRSSEPSFVLSIISRPTGYTLSAADLAALDDACVAASPSRSLTLGDQAFETLMFQDTPCGPHGSTLIYVNSGLTGYRIQIETTAGYQSVAADVSRILETLTFGVSNDSSGPKTIPQGDLFGSGQLRADRWENLLQRHQL
jgi:hypothetical protein